MNLIASPTIHELNFYEGEKRVNEVMLKLGLWHVSIFPSRLIEKNYLESRNRLLQDKCLHTFQATPTVQLTKKLVVLAQVNVKQQTVVGQGPEQLLSH